MQKNAKREAAKAYILKKKGGWSIKEEHNRSKNEKEDFSNFRFHATVCMYFDKNDISGKEKQKNGIYCNTFSSLLSSHLLLLNSSRWKEFNGMHERSHLISTPPETPNPTSRLPFNSFTNARQCYAHQILPLPKFIFIYVR